MKKHGSIKQAIVLAALSLLFLPALQDFISIAFGTV